MKTLIVEDDFVSRLVMQKMLEPFGQCDLAVNGKEAVQAFTMAFNEKMPYDLICLDIMMPEMDGKEALKKIRQIERELEVQPEFEVKILMVTALDTPKEVVDAYYNGGCTSYLVKPIEKIKIHDKLKELGLM